MVSVQLFPVFTLALSSPILGLLLPQCVNQDEHPVYTTLGHMTFNVFFFYRFELFENEIT